MWTYNKIDEFVLWNIQNEILSPKHASSVSPLYMDRKEISQESSSAMEELEKYGVV